MTALTRRDTAGRHDIDAALSRVIEHSAGAAGCPVRVAAHGRRRWASATFSGARHAMTISAAPTPQLDRWLGTLPDADFTLRGHLVADLKIMAVRRCPAHFSADIEVLTLEAV